MPTKMNRAGEQQNYIPSGNGDRSGEYTDQKTSAKGFKNFSKNVDNKSNKFLEFSKSEKLYNDWLGKTINAERRGNPPEEIKTKLEETPIKKIDQTDIDDVINSGHDPKAVKLASDLIRRYENNIDETSKDLSNIANKNNGLMVGLEFRLKRLSSLTRKLESYVIEEHSKGNTNFTLEDAVNKARDVERYTIVFDGNGFEKSVDNVIKSLNKKGYKLVRAKNTFVEGAEYKGLNCNFLDKNGNIFELQFHIPESIKTKEGIEVDLKNKKAISNRVNLTSHDIYETTRIIEDKIKSKTATPDEIKLYNYLKKKAVDRWKNVPNYNLNF